MQTILITDNDDGTKKVYMQNMNKDGEEIIIHKAKIDFDIYYESGAFIKKCEADIKMSCLKNKEGEIFQVKDTRSNLSNNELINEIRTRIENK